MLKIDNSGKYLKWCDSSAVSGDITVDFLSADTIRVRNLLVDHFDVRQELVSLQKQLDELHIKCRSVKNDVLDSILDKVVTKEELKSGERTVSNIVRDPYGRV